MARPVTVIPKPAEHPEAAREELKRRIENAPVEHAAALLSLWDLLQAAHDSHALEIARGTISASNDIIERLAHAARSESAIRALRNILLLSEVIGAVDPEVLRGVVRTLPAALARAHEETQRSEPPSLLQILRRLTSRDARRAEGLFANLLASIGYALPPRNKS